MSAMWGWISQTLVGVLQGGPIRVAKSKSGRIRRVQPVAYVQSFCYARSASAYFFDMIDGGVLEGDGGGVERVDLAWLKSIFGLD